MEITDTIKREFICHTHYSLLYAKEYEQAFWVAYELVADKHQPNNERIDNFITNPNVSARTAVGDDYVVSGYYFINIPSFAIDSIEACPGLDLHFQFEDVLEAGIEGKIDLEIFNNL